MTEELVQNFVWNSAGLGFREDGVYVLDFGWEERVATWDETWWSGPDDLHPKHDDKFDEYGVNQ